jgi:hypothetical protein
MTVGVMMSLACMANSIEMQVIINGCRPCSLSHVKYRRSAEWVLALDGEQFVHDGSGVAR